MTIATVLIPTWDAPDSLGDAIDSARRQSVADIEILVVSDGAKPDTVRIAEVRASADDRVRVLHLPKGEARGERNRHLGVLDARSPNIVYLADDDLIMPEHVAMLVDALATHDLAQSANAYIDGAGELRLLAAQLADPRWREWHLADPPLNRISITGTAHTRDAYARLQTGWTIPKPGYPADLTLWRQFFSDPRTRAVTLNRVTTLQFPAPNRREMSGEQVECNRAPWVALAARASGQEELDALASAAVHRELLEEGLAARTYITDIHTLIAQRDEARAEIDRLRQPGLLARLRGRRRPPE